MPVKSIAQNIRMLVLDVDGVLTDAGLYLDGAGNELKRFNAQDGLGIKILNEIYKKAIEYKEENDFTI